MDVILALTVLELAALSIWHRRTGRGVAGGMILANLLAGAFLLLAIRVALAGAAWPLMAFCLAGAGAAHVVDLRQRWR